MPSLTKYAISLVVLLCSILACEAMEWHDCGMPLQRWVNYEDVTLSPSDSIQTGTLLSLNVFAVVSQVILPLDTVNTQLMIVKDGQLFMNTTTRNLCDMLSANSQGCAYREGQKISYTYQFLVPDLPRGNYTIRLFQTSTVYHGAEVGCVQLTTAVEGLTTKGSCTYQSEFDAQFQGTFHFKNANPTDQQVGDFIQVGPWGDSAGSSANGYDWGIFQSITGTKDIVGPSEMVNSTNYRWGLNGTLVSVVNSTGVHVYNGTVVVGYQNVNQSANTTSLQFVYGGNFNLQFQPRSGGSRPEYNLQTSYIALFSKWYHPVGFPYPLVVGNLDPLQISATNVVLGTDAVTGAPSPVVISALLSGTKQWCTCGNTCGLGSGDFDRSQVAAGTKSGLSLTAQAAIAVGVVGSVALIMGTIFFVVHYRSSKRPILDPSEVVYPNKPDYGNLALGEIIDEESGDHRLL